MDEPKYLGPLVEEPKLVDSFYGAPEPTPAPNENISWLEQHPNLYGLVRGGIYQTALDVIPYAKYIEPSERDRFMKLSEQPQMRELLMEDLNLVLGMGAGRIAKGAGQIVAKYFPKTAEFFTTPVGKLGDRLLGRTPVEEAAGRVVKPMPEGPPLQERPLTLTEEVPPTPPTLPQEARTAEGATGMPTSPEVPLTLTDEVKPTMPPEEPILLTEDAALPKYAGSINLERQNIPDSMKQMELQAAEQVPRVQQSWDATGKLSQDILKDYEQSQAVIAKAKAGEGLNSEEILAARQMNVNALTKLKVYAENLSPEEFNGAFQSYTDNIFTAVSDASSEIGRALNIHKKEVGLTRLTKSFTELNRNLRPDEIKRFKNLDMGNPEAVQQFTQSIKDPRLRDYMYEYWYNAILSGIPTHLVNVGSNTMWSLFQVPHQVLASGIDPIVSTLAGSARTRFINETIPMMSGMVKGFERGAGGAWQMVKSASLTNSESKWAQEMGYAVGAFERSPNAFLRKIAPAITMPTRALRAMDVWANSIAYDARAQMLARRASTSQGLVGDAKTTFEKSFLENLPAEANKDASAFAKYNTFMDDPGVISSWIIQGRSKIPMARFVIPFVTTIGNLMKRGLEMTPGIGLALSKGQHPTEVIAKQIEGSILTLYTLYKLDKGEITGAPPDNPAEREAFYREKKIPWGIKQGDTWYQYRRFEPFATPIASVATLYDKLKNAKEDPKSNVWDNAAQAFMDTALGYKNYLLDSSYLQGMSQVFERYGSPKGALQKQLASFVPYSGFWRSINRSYEAFQEGEAKVRDTGTWLGAFSQTIPGLYGQMPTKLDIWGQEIPLPGGVFRQWLPYKWSEETTDPVERELERLKVYPGAPKQTVDIRGKQTVLDFDVYRDYQIAYGANAKERLAKVIDTEQYQRVTNEERQKKILDSELTKVRERMLVRAKKKQVQREGLQEPIRYLGPQ